MSRAIAPGDWVVMPVLPPWVSSLPAHSRRVFEFCVGKSYRVVELDDFGGVVMDVSSDIDALFGGYMNDIRVEPEYLTLIDGPA